MMSKVKLGPLVEIKTGKLDANAEAADGQYPFFTCSKDNKRINRYSFDGEYVIVAGNGDLNVKYYSGKFDAYQRTYTLKPSPQLDGKFLYHFLSKYVERLREQSIGGVIKYIKLGNLTDALIPLPPLEEQKKIATILDAADEYRQKTKALIDKYDQLSQSLFLDMFGDPVTNPKGWDKSLIRNVAEAKNGYAFKSTDYLEKGVPLIRMSNFNNGPVEIKDTIKVSNVFLESRKNFILQNNDFVIALSGATTGKYGIYQHDFPSLLNQRIGLIRAKPVVSVTYLHEFLKLKSNEIFKMAAGAAQPNVSLKEIQEITIPVPPLYLQNRFATSLNNIKSQKQQAEASLVKAEDLFNSLLQRAFKGELTN